MFGYWPMNFFGGSSFRKVNHAANRFFISFDDGPDPSSTPELLNWLDQKKMKASFFLVAEKAKVYPGLCREIVQAGHFLGNHSLDHRYHHFFKRASSLVSWIQNAQKILEEITGQKPRAFRSPAGVQTPELRKALSNLNLPLVHWNRRYFDAVIPFTSKRAHRAGREVQSGDIILLHDIPRRNSKQFTLALDALYQETLERGLLGAELKSAYFI